MMNANTSSSPMALAFAAFYEQAKIAARKEVAQEIIEIRGPDNKFFKFIAHGRVPVDGHPLTYKYVISFTINEERYTLFFEEQQSHEELLRTIEKELTYIFRDTIFNELRKAFGDYNQYFP